MKRALVVLGISLPLAAVIIGAVYGYFVYQKLQLENRMLAERTAVLDKLGEAATGSLANEKNLNQDLTDANGNLNQSLQTEQSKNQAFSNQIQQLSGTVGQLQKLSQLPPELLKKYSKVYFLNENYVPAPLVNIDPQYLFSTTKEQKFLAPALPYLVRMLQAAGQDGKTLKIVSAYRSFGDQTAVKSGYKVFYGSGANQFSADQGYSEHQLGTAVDLTTPDTDGLYVSLDGTPEYAWLTQNAYKFGFVLSYPKGNGYYQYEPWHWRFVGVALATSVHDQNVHFYDMPQSAIDKFLINIFD